MKWFVVSGARVVAVLLQLIYIKMYTNLLSLNELGDYAFWFTVAYFFNALVFVPLDNYQQSRLYKWKDAGISLQGAIRLNITMLLLCSGAILVAAPVVMVLQSRRAAVAFVLSLSYGLLLHISNASRNLVINLNRQSMGSLFVIIDGIIKIFVLQLLQRFVTIDSVILIASATLSSLLSSAIYLVVMASRGVFFTGRMQAIAVREALAFGYPISISAMLNWLQLQGYRLVLVPLGASEAIGAFATVSSIGGAGMNAVAAIYNQLRTPEIYHSGGRSINSYLRGILALTAVVAFGGWLFSEHLVRLLTKKVLVEHAGLIIFGVLVEGGNLALGAMGIAYSLSRPTRVFISVGLCGFLSSALGFAVLFKWIHVTNIGYPLVLSQTTAVLYMWFVMKRDRLARAIPTLPGR